MSNYTYTSDILADVLFRSGEKTDGSSDFYDAALRYINRAYQAIWMGGTEFDTTINDLWWWLRREESWVLDTQITTGTAFVRNGNFLVELSSSPSDSIAGWFFKTNDDPNIFRVLQHTAGNDYFQLDAVYTGARDTTAGYKLFKLEYELATDAIKIIDPMTSYRDAWYEITGESMRNLQRDYPLNLMESGVPTRFAMVDSNTVRFNKSGPTDATSGIKVDYHYLVKPSDLTNSGSQEPLIPLEYRRLLGDIALYWLFLDKNDDRASIVGAGAKALLRAMSRENRSRWANWGDYASIKVRQSWWNRHGLLRTETGAIIG